MQHERSEYFRKRKQDKKRRKVWQKAVLGLSCLVVFCTVYALILPAITLERKTVCGKKEHIHTEACYADLQQTELICGEEAHQHTETCYAQEEALDPADRQKEEGKDGQVSEKQSGQDAVDPVLQSEDAGESMLSSSDGFDLSTNSGYISEVTLHYQNPGSDTWTELSDKNENVIRGDAKIRLTVGYKDIGVEQLRDNYQCSITYNIPNLLRNAFAEGKIMDENKKDAGLVEVVGDKIVLTFKEEYMNQLLAENKSSISGDFYATGEVNLGQLPDDGKSKITIAGKEYQIDFGENPVAQYGKVTVEKECISEKVISTEAGDFLAYKIKVTAGEDGSKEVTVVDTFKTNAAYLSYEGISSAETQLSENEEGQKPYETIEEGKSHGSIYRGNLPTEEKPIPDAGASEIAEPGSLVWRIGDMSAGESRTLTYYVKLHYEEMSKAQNGKYMNTVGDFRNGANVYSMTYKKSYDEATFTPKWSHNVSKGTISNEKKETFTRNGDGSYTIRYRLNFDLRKDGSNFPLKDFEFQDYLNHERNKTDAGALKYIDYLQDSLEVYGKKDGSAEFTKLDPTAYVKEWAEDGNSFKVKIKEQANPGDSYYVTYSVKVQPEAMAAIKGNKLSVNNRLIVAASNADKGMGTGFQAYSTNNVLSYDTWDLKKVGEKTAEDQTILMNGEKYDATGENVKKDSSGTAEFTVPAGSYPYTVDVNTLGDWDMTGVKMTDRLDSEYMQYVGYVKIDAYDPKDSVNGGNVNAPKETKWVKIDGMNSFALCPSDLGWKNQDYAYRFTYYAQPVNTGAFSEVVVGNKFILEGNAVRGGNKFDITGMTAQRSVTISGNYSMNIKKTAWYYEEPSAGGSTWEKGKIYWVIEVDGTAIKKDMQIRDEIQQKSGTTLSYLHADSLAGIYQGTLPAEKGITEYQNLEEFSAVEGMQNITSKFTTKFTNDKKFKGEDQYSELIVTAKEKISLDGEKIYFVICSEPETLPASGRDSKEYQNGVSTSDNGAAWIDRGTANKMICAGGDILKELGQTFLYDGSKLTNIVPGKDNADRNKIVTSQLPGAGLYASWAFKVNYGGELSGRYRVLEQIPDGMEFAYIRVKWTGTKQKKINSYAITDLPEGWQKKTITAGTDNGTQETTISYVKGQEALIELGDFIAGNEKDSYSVDVQVVCRVTDRDVLLGGEKKTFTNRVVLQTTDGREISTASNPATMEMKNISKEGQTDKEKVSFTIKANPLGQRLPTEDGMTKLKLIDKLSSTLILDTSTIKAVKTGTETEVPIVASLGSNNTLEIELPCDEAVTITYTATVNAPPGQKVSFSNNAYWEGYTSSGGAGVKQDGYSYAAGGTVSAGDNIRLKIIKKDQNNLALGLAGAGFEMVRCTLDTQNDKMIEDPGAKWSGTTDENGILNFGSGDSGDPVMSYNTVYKVTETKAPDGYMLESEPFYIMVPKIEKNASDYSDYVKQCIADSRISVQYQSTYELTVSNHKGEITVEKYFQNVGGKKSNPVSGTYWFALYDHADGTGDPLQKVSITYHAESTEVQRAKFTNLDLTAKYYVFELDDGGQPITNPTQVSSVGGMEYFTSYSTKKADGTVTNGNDGGSGDTVQITNQSRVRELPSTGSCGVWIYRISGGILLILAGMLALYHRKKQK